MGVDKTTPTFLFEIVSWAKTFMIYDSLFRIQCFGITPGGAQCGMPQQRLHLKY